jgi:hypothetical protein
VEDMKKLIALILALMLLLIGCDTEFIKNAIIWKEMLWGKMIINHLKNIHFSQKRCHF